MGSILCFGVVSQFLYGLAWDAEMSAREKGQWDLEKNDLNEKNICSNCFCVGFLWVWVMLTLFLLLFPLVSGWW